MPILSDNKGRVFPPRVYPSTQIAWNVGLFTVKATICDDDDNGPPDVRNEGFWPSLDPQDAGYIGPKSPRALKAAQRRAQAIHEGWKNNAWFYVGVEVNVFLKDAQLTDNFTHALWGIEANYPTRKGKNPNAYLTEVAYDLAKDALDDAEEKLVMITEMWAKAHDKT